MNIVNDYLCREFGAALAGIAALFRGSHCKVRYGYHASQKCET